MTDPDPGEAHNVRLKCSPAAVEEVKEAITAHNTCEVKAQASVRHLGTLGESHASMMDMSRRATRTLPVNQSTLRFLIPAWLVTK
jgi:hypothetical protein